MTQSYLIADLKKTREFEQELSACIRKSGKHPNDFTLRIMLAYALFTAQSESPDAIPDLDSVLARIKKTIPMWIAHANAISEYWEAIEPIYGVYSVRSIASYILDYNSIKNTHRFFSTPKSLINLASEILQINDNDLVADLGTGCGSFIIESYKENATAEYYGVEIEANMAVVSAIRAQLLGTNITIEQKNMYEIWDHNRKFTKVFSNYPFNVRDLMQSGGFNEMSIDRFHMALKNNTSDWAFNLLMTDSITEKGKAIGIMTRGSCFSKADRGMRKYFIENGLIEAIIALPNRIFPDTNISTVMIVLSRGNKAVRMVDASNLYKRDGRQVGFSDEHIRKILIAMENNSDYSYLLSESELVEIDYNLEPVKKREIPDYIKGDFILEGVIDDITRGAQIRNDELDELQSDSPTDYQYVMLKDIQEGIINDKLGYLKKIEPQLQKYCLSEENLILAKNGAPFKVAIAEGLDGKTVLANGNLYIIDLNKTKIRPHYLKAFLESDDGQKMLNNIAVGANMLTINVPALKAMPIPCPSLEEQDEIVDKYRQVLKNIQTLKQQLASAIEMSKSFFNKDG